MGRRVAGSRAVSWDQRPNETDVAYGAFVVYRDLGVKRTTREVARLSSKSRALMLRWSSQHDWVERCRDWAAHQQREFDAEMSEERIRIARRQLRLADIAIGKVIQRLSSLDPSELSPADVLRYFVEMAKVERAAAGATESTIALQHTGEVVNPGLERSAMARRIIADPELRAASLDLLERASRSEPRLPRS